jgi:hypothetical protein
MSTAKRFGRRGWITGGLGVALLLLVGFAVLVTVFGSSCGGQCSAPYELDVQFHLGTPPAEASAVLQSCRHFPTVIGVASPSVNSSGLLVAKVETRDFLRNAKTQPLLTCLTGSPSVVSAAWPN